VNIHVRGDCQPAEAIVRRLAFRSYPGVMQINRPDRDRLDIYDTKIVDAWYEQRATGHNHAS
jgi:hypothetical protein